MHSIREMAGWVMLCVAAAGAVACAAEQPDPKGDVVARVGDVKITLSELDQEAMRLSLQPFQALYDARSAALDGMIDNLLLEQEATLRGITSEELVAQEISAKVAVVSDADVQTFYTQNQNRMGGKSVEEMTPAIRDFLESGSAAQTRQRFIATLRSKGSVRVSLDPPRAEVIIAKNDPSKGPAGAPITIVEYSDFQ